MERERKNGKTLGAGCIQIGLVSEHITVTLLNIMELSKKCFQTA